MRLVILEGVVYVRHGDEVEIRDDEGYIDYPSTVLIKEFYGKKVRITVEEIT